MNAVHQKSVSIAFSDQQTLHMRHIYVDDNNHKKPVVFMLHGAVENGKIFYTKSNKGLGPWLARQGFQVYIADLRGRGDSLPAINSKSSYGQTEAIIEDIPAFLAEIEQRHPGLPQYWIGHSWGGVLLNCFLARNPDHISKIKACAYFGVKRSIFNWHPKRYIVANLMWNRVLPKMARKHGYLPARKLKVGSDDETLKSLQQSVQWVKQNPWVDSDDGFDYAAALINTALPPTLHIAGTKDVAIARPRDIRRFIKESGKGKTELKLYGKKFGHGQDYDHINMLTHPAAQNDQFADLLRWFKQFGESSSLKKAI
ncbi:alpha/beta fold hydrolase [Pelagibaculum spongiae]|uniref:Esterase n=1 Tax=Pelagibaculum spongiae TaxID=2080658 RepID=A0A2V1GPY3_9GAMM|nr:alpha/beta fold hydrolase [Pelagibaculum spongiae]PVZ65463.1 esterase [Pelagibaculum spongiae]